MDTGGKEDATSRHSWVRRLLAAALILVAAFIAFAVYAVLSRPRPAKIAWSTEVSDVVPHALRLRKGGGIVYSGSDRIVFLDAGGKAISEFLPNGFHFTRSAVDTSGNVYVGDDAGYIYALDADGSELWRLLLAPEKPQQPKPYNRSVAVTVTEAGEILAQTSCGEIFLLSHDHEILKRAEFPIDFLSWTNPLVLPNGNVIAVDTDGSMCEIHCLTLGGEVLWQAALSGELPRPVLLVGRVIVFATGDGVAKGYDFDGNELWSFSNPDQVAGGPKGFNLALAGNDHLVILTHKRILMLDDHGRKIWENPGGSFWNCLARSKDSFYVTRSLDRWLNKAYWEVWERQPRVNDLMREPQLSSELILFESGKECKVQTLPDEFVLRCGPGPEGELYGWATKSKRGQVFPDSYTIYRIDP